DEVGYGFGFRIVLDYVRKNKGNLQIESKPQDGTTVINSLPKCQDEKLEIQTDDRQDVELTINKNLLSGKSILIVDDDELILEHITELLSPYVEVHQAHDGEHGISQAQTYVPDLIISDVEMPNMNGLEMYEKLTGDLLTSNIPLLFLSAKTDDNIRLKGLSIGALDYITKPFDDDELLVKICNFLMWHQKIQVTALTKTLEGEEESTDKINPLLEKIILLVKENYTNPLYSLTEFTQDLGMSKSTLCRRLKAITDKTAMEILTEYRLNMAKNMLADGNISVSDVAYAVGFNDPLYFSRRFKQFFGYSPKSAR
ncbi:MAG: response regulator, partial [Paludibacteraceae bacterium]|nr:response regulator [Paludibacteraceae bacterium]